MSIKPRRELTTKPKLLVVDDEPDNLDLLYRTFYRKFTVLRAESGHAALATLVEHPDVAVIISDQRMPGMSGTEFLRQTAVQYPNIMRIILTGYTDVEDLVGAINQGKVFKYVTKPWEAHDLKLVVTQALDAHQLLRSRTEELERVLQQETLLNAMTNTIRSADTAQAMMQTVVETVGQHMGADICVLQPLGEAATTVTATIYTAAALTDRETTLLPSDLAWAVTEMTALNAGSISTNEDHPAGAACADLDVQASLLVPLISKQQPLAVLALHRCGATDTWGESDRQLLANVATQTALALSQALTYEQVQALARREQLLNAVTQAIRSSLEPQAIFAAITQELGQVLSVDSCVLSLWTAADDYMQCVGLYEAHPDGSPVPHTSEADPVLPRSQTPIRHNPVLQELLITQQPIQIDDLSQHPEMRMQDQPRRSGGARSLLVVPLMTESQIIGSISLRHIHRPHPWQPGEVELAQSVASQAAIAVQQSRLYQKTREQTEQLMALDRQKTEFFQNISHEFRTPLTLTLGPLETAVSHGRGLTLEESTVALRNARRLLRLVNQLLDLQRLDAGRMQPTFRPVNVAAFIEDVVTAFQPYCERQGLQLQTHLTGDSIVFLDLEKFDKVLYNLLSNAVKFTPTGGTISVVLEATDSHCTVKVSDTGIGIHADQLPHLFDRFRQADGSTNRRYEGTGLGLALVKELVSLHHGSIDVASTYGQGTTFAITLPTGHHHLPAEQIVTQAATIEISRAEVELADISMMAEDEAAAAMTHTSPNGLTGMPRILVVDDNSDLRSYISNVLQRQGYQVRTAQDGVAALAMLETFTPNLILTDLMMPGISGLELLRQIRQTESLRSIPIVLLTAKVDDETRIEGVEQGADAYLGKPFNDRELLAEVRNLLALKANEQKVRELNQYLTESVLRRFLPETLVNKAAAGDLQLVLQPEPRQIAVLFSDIVSFTPLSDRLGPRRLAQVLNEYLNAMTEAIFASGGTVDKFMGDGVLALFGAPEELPPDEQARRAIAAVHCMHDTLDQLNQQWQTQDIPEIRVRYGIHQGDAVVGMFGGAARADYTAIGPCVNIASRLQEVAEPNGVLVSATLAQHLPKETIVSCYTAQLRGLQVPLQVCSIQL
ncbi:response regulator [Halomicronema sp. CCY15110]|uniref:response regulator n=1 Tax=Halomicronema sp. CCY15110 TaxID=2767773 RepID=UPI00194DE687|nr:response regulator [Halomicronema sp. CCY15110]